MRPLALTFLALAALSAIAAEYPLWNGESIEEYAKKVGLPPTKTLDLGNGVTMEFVLIPAGTFTMGTEVPRPVDEAAYRSKILTGQVVLAVGGGMLLVLLGVVLIRAIRKRQRPQYSLAWFLFMTVAAGIGLMGGFHWQYSTRAFDEASAEYEGAMARYNAADDGEKHGHQVTLTEPYYVGKYEVTQEQYQQVMGINPSAFKGCDLPVETVSWTSSQEFCKTASERTGRSLRLPTEAEWEHACRAGTKTRYCTGDSERDLDRAAWNADNSTGSTRIAGPMRASAASSDGTTHAVGQKTPNAWGLYDMHGNVSEWCADWFDAYKAEAAVDPQGPPEGQHRVLRGGSLCTGPEGCRSASRYGSLGRSSDNGFRVIVEVISPTALTDGSGSGSAPEANRQEKDHAPTASDKAKIVPLEELARFLDTVKTQDYHRMRREGEKVFQTNLYIPDHEAKFKGFAVSEPQPGHLHYSFFSVKGTGGAAEIAVVLDKKTGRIIMFSARDVSF